MSHNRPMRPRPSHRHDGPQRPHAVALLDLRFLAWLADVPHRADVPPHREHLMAVAQHALAQCACREPLLRVHTYTDLAQAPLLDDQVNHRVLPEDEDGGLSMVRAMAADLLAVAQQGGAQTVLIGSDDDRLLLPIDQARAQGVRVVLLADERAEHLDELAETDAAWVRLMHEVDRRAIVPSLVLAQALRGEAPPPLPPEAFLPLHEGHVERPHRERPPRNSRDHDELLIPPEELDKLISAWWDEQPEEARAALRHALPESRGLPAEVDRDLLLRTKSSIGRALHFSEKKVLRERAREVALMEP